MHLKLNLSFTEQGALGYVESFLAPGHYRGSQDNLWPIVLFPESLLYCVGSHFSAGFGECHCNNKVECSLYNVKQTLSI